MGRKAWSVGLGAFVVVCVLTAQSAFASAPGDADPSFGTGGTVEFAGGAEATLVAARPSGGTLYSVLTPTGQELVAVRADGSLDPTFGTGGVVTLNPPWSVNGIATDSSDRILVTLVRSFQPPVNARLLRLQANGATDTTFGFGGSIDLSYADGTVPRKALPLASGRILVLEDPSYNGREPRNFDLQLTVLTSSGLRDTSVAPHGRITFDLGADETLDSAAETPTGKVLLTGIRFNQGNERTVVVRLTKTLHLDASFGDGDGWTQINAGGQAKLLYTPIVYNGLILVPGSVLYPSSSAYAFVAALDASGHSVPTWNGGHLLVLPTAGASDGIAVALGQQSTRTIAMVTIGVVPRRTYFVRFDSTAGTLETSFGSGGRITTPDGTAYDGMVVVASTVTVGGLEERAFSPQAIARRIFTDATLPRTG